MQRIDRLYTMLARLKFEIYNLRREADVEYTAVCGVVTCKDEKGRLVLEEKEKGIGLELAAIKRNVDDTVESRTKLTTSEITQWRNRRGRDYFTKTKEKRRESRPCDSERTEKHLTLCFVFCKGEGCPITK